MNPFLGVFYHSVGGFASGSFYLPYKKVRRWAWESYWLAGGVFSWIIGPWAVALIVTSLGGADLIAILKEGFANHPRAMLYAYIFGAMWGVGGLTFGLTMRYLGMSLGMAVALGFCAFFGTIIPPIYEQFKPKADLDKTIVGLLQSTSGLVTLGGLAICLLGIVFCGLAGIEKERQLPDEEKKKTIAEFNFTKGMWVAVFSGIMSACMAFAISSGSPLGDIAQKAGVNDVVKNTPALIVVLAGGFTTNFIWCMYLNASNRTFGDYVSGRGASIGANYFFSALAGITWYLQFFFYSMGQTQMGKYDFASWTLHMATIIIFSNMWGILLQEWRGTSKRVHQLIFTGIAVLVFSTFVVGFGTYLKQGTAATTAPSGAHAMQTVAPAGNGGHV